MPLEALEQGTQIGQSSEPTLPASPCLVASPPTNSSVEADNGFNVRGQSLYLRRRFPAEFNTGYWRPERSLRCPPAARLTPSQAGRRPRRRSPESVPGPGPGLFRPRKRSAVSLALLVRRSLCRSCFNLNAECQAPVQCFCIAPEDYFLSVERTASVRPPLERQSGDASLTQPCGPVQLSSEAPNQTPKGGSRTVFCSNPASSKP
jgi:hypothetical protein